MRIFLKVIHLYRSVLEPLFFIQSSLLLLTNLFIGIGNVIVVCEVSLIAYELVESNILFHSKDLRFPLDILPFKISLVSRTLLESTHTHPRII